MMRGRKPKPSALRILQGNPGHRKISKGESKPTSGLPTPPGWLDLKALEEWKFVIPELTRMGILAKIDHAKLGIYCQAMSDIHTARTMIRKFGQVIKQDGRLQQSPWVRIQNAAEVKVYKFASDFGFSPSDRMRLSIDSLEENEKDKSFFG